MAFICGMYASTPHVGRRCLLTRLIEVCEDEVPAPVALGVGHRDDRPVLGALAHLQTCKRMLCSSRILLSSAFLVLPPRCRRAAPCLNGSGVHGREQKHAKICKLHFSENHLSKVEVNIICVKIAHNVGVHEKLRNLISNFSMFKFNIFI